MALISFQTAWAGKVTLSYEPGDDADSLEKSLKLLVEQREILSLNSIHVNILKDNAMNQQLVKALEKQSGKEVASLNSGIGRGSFHHPDVQNFRRHLQPAVLSLEPFKKLPAALAEHGLKIDRCNCEKFAFERECGKTRATGIAIYLHVAPVDFGMEMRKDAIKGNLSLSRVFREGDQWVGIFSLSQGQAKGARFYGRWSPQHDMFVIDHYRMGWADKLRWSASEVPTFAENEQTFRLKKETYHAVRVELGSQSHPRASVRIYGIGGSLDSQEFVLNKESHSYREDAPATEKK